MSIPRPIRAAKMTRISGMPPVNDEEISSVVLPIWATTKVESMIMLELGNLLNPCANHKPPED